MSKGRRCGPEGGELEAPPRVEQQGTGLEVQTLSHHGASPRGRGRTEDVQKLPPRGEQGHGHKGRQAQD